MAANVVVDNENYSKIQHFLKSRSLDYLLPSFVCYKIDDNVASDVTDAKLLEIGLVYGDILAYKQEFTATSNTIKSYEQRAEELKHQLKKNHVFGIDSKNRQIRVLEVYKVTFGLKCYEKKCYVAKRNKSHSIDCKRMCTYEEMHTIARNLYNVPDRVKTFLAQYNGKKMESTFKNLEQYALSQKEKKKAILLYLYYPKSYSSFTLDSFLKISQIPSDESDGDFETFADIEVEEKGNICQVCSCTYHISCIRCEQNLEYQASLSADQEKQNQETHSHLEDHSNSVIVVEDEIVAEEGDVEEEPEIHPENNAALREARISHFSLRYVQRPIRFRHSIGSPSLNQPPVCQTSNEINSEVFGDDEVDRFFANDIPADFELNQNNVEEKDVSEMDFLKCALERFKFKRLIQMSPRHIIVQRDQNKFWNILLKQSFDAEKHDFIIRFAGEAAADAGGPYKEFLTLCMKYFNLVPGLFFGSTSALCFKAAPQDLEMKTYYKLGQLTGLSILNSARGPECLHFCVVDALYSKESNDVINVDDAELQAKLQQIEEGNFDEMLDNNILPSGDKEKDKMMFAKNYVIFSRYHALEHFRKGLMSIDSALGEPDNVVFMRKYLQVNNKSITLNEFVALLKINRDGILGSNKRSLVESAICEFEIYLAEVANGDHVGISLEDILFFFTGFDRIPPHGLDDPLDINFEEDIVLPKVSTCSRTVVLPVKNVGQAMKTAIKFCSGFGEI